MERDGCASGKAAIGLTAVETQHAVVGEGALANPIVAIAQQTGS